METFNFRKENYVYDYPPQAAGTFRDTRNSIMCTNPALNMQCYINYIELLDGMRDMWKNHGYLHMGMMPVVMGPSFMHRQLLDVIGARLNEIGLIYYSVPPVSLMHDVCKIEDHDIWMFREDAAEYMGRSNTTAVEFLRRILACYI